MKKVTKNAKPVKVKFIKVQEYYSKYLCPTCRAEFSGGVGRSVLSFLCSCGQKLKVV